MEKKADFLLVNDLHCTSNTLQEFRKNWMEAFDVCERYGIEHILIGGDVFTSQASQTLPVLMAVKEMFEAGVNRGICFDVAAGNHDKSDKEAVESYCHVFRNEHINVIDAYNLIGCDDYAIALISYFPENGSFKEKLEDVKASCKKYDYDLDEVILYIHEGVKGALGGLELDTECEPEWFDGFKAVLCGHYHDRKVLKGTNIEYIGSSRQHNFGENDLKGYTIVFEDGSYEFVQNEVNIRYRTIEMDYNDDLDFEEDTRYKTRLKLNCTDAQAKLVDKKKLADMGINKVELVTEKVKAVKIKDTDISQRFDKTGIKKEYKTFCNTKEIEPDLGLKYLDKLS